MTGFHPKRFTVYRCKLSYFLFGRLGLRRVGDVATLPFFLLLHLLLSFLVLLFLFIQFAPPFFKRVRISAHLSVLSGLGRLGSIVVLVRRNRCTQVARFERNFFAHGDPLLVGDVVELAGNQRFVAQALLITLQGGRPGGLGRNVFRISHTSLYHADGGVVIFLSSEHLQLGNNPGCAELDEFPAQDGHGPAAERYARLAHLDAYLRTAG